jgi:hypothetical protein
MANQRLNIDIVARDKSKQALNGVQKSLARLKNSVFSLQSAFVGIGAGLVIKNLVNTGKSLENLRTRLKFLLKDTNEGAKAFENMTKFASKVPFSLEEIQAGAGILATVTDNADDLQKMLEITGNVASVTGLDFRTAGEQIQRSFSAGIGSADIFREKGVRNMLGFKAGATVSIEETVQAFEKVFGKGGRFGNATDELAKTFEGTLSMIGDKVFNFKKVLLEAGFFEELKKQFGSLDKFLEDNAKELDKIAISVGKNLAQGMVKVVQIGKDLIPTLENIGKILKNIGDGFMALPPFIRTSGIIGAFLFGKKGLVALASVSLFVDKVQDLIKESKVRMGIFDIDNLKEVNLAVDTISNKINELELEKSLTLDVDSPNLDKKLKKAKEELEILKERQKVLQHSANIRKFEAFENQKELHKGLKTHEQINKELEKRLENTARENGLIRNQTQQIETLKDKIKNLNNESLENIRNKFKDIKTTIAEGINNGITMMSQSLAKTLVFGENLKDTFKKLAGEVLVKILAILIEQIARMTVQIIMENTMIGQLAVKLGIEKKITNEKKKQASFSGASTGASLLNIGLGFLGFAKGGAVSKGQPIVVGEQGAELFVPNQTGQITQSARGTGGGNGTTVNFNINTLDASGFEDLLFRSRGTISALINQAVNEQGRGAVI